jgi:hypothetical protein
MILNSKQYYLHCDCIGGQMDHMAMFHYWEDEPDFAYVEIHMVQTPFFKRFWKAIRYLVFGELHDYGHWHEIVINEKSAQELAEFLEGYIKAWTKYSKSLGYGPGTQRT